MMWLKSCLHRTQDNQSFNSIGKLEIPEMVLEELLQNALVHYDLLKTAAIRLMVFDDRVEIVNPGCVFGGHTLDEVLLGNSFARNPLMANFCAKTMPYRGLGSGIPRVMSENCHVEFVDSKEGNQFIVRIMRPNLGDNKAGGTAVSNANLAVSREENTGGTAVSNANLAVSKEDKLVKIERQLLEFCKVPRSLTEICENFDLKDRYKAKKKYINPLLGIKLQMTKPNSPNSPNQKYVTIK